MNYKSAHSPLARHVQNQSRITPMRRICSFTDFYSVWLDSLRLPGAIIVTDYLLLEAILRRIGANTIHVSFTTEFFRTRIYRIQADKIDINR